MTSAETNVIQLAERLYGVTRRDLTVSENFDNPQDLIRRSQGNPRVQALFAQLATDNLTAQTPVAQRINVPLRNGARVVDWVKYTVKDSEGPAGEAHHFLGPVGDRVFAVRRTKEGMRDFRYIQFQDVEDVGRTVFDHQGKVVQSSIRLRVDLTGVSIETDTGALCKSLCHAVCDAGAEDTLGECLGACLLAGPEDEPICLPLCYALVSIGCFIGCDAVCAAV